MKEELRECRRCSKTFYTRRQTQRYCCDKCRLEDRKRKPKKRENRSAKENRILDRMRYGLEEDAVKASDHNMQYGEYQSKYYLKLQSAEMAKKRKQLKAQWEKEARERAEEKNHNL